MTTIRKMSGKILAGLFAASLFIGTALRAEVKTYPAPEGQDASGTWTVKVNGEPVAIYSAMTEKEGKEYYFASFDFSETVAIEITSEAPLANLQIVPERFGVQTIRRDDHSVTLQADSPFQISLEPNGIVKPLHLFGNGLETDVPDFNDPNVVYYGPGLHRADLITLTDHQTLYLAGGAVVQGAVNASGKNIVIRGRGVLAGEVYPRWKGPGPFMIHATDCEDLTIRDITLRNPWSWTLVTSHCRRVLIDNVKICGSRMLNDDAVDLVNTQNAVVRNCFLRSQDDNIAIKGLGVQSGPCEDILVEDSSLWTDRANNFRIGYECEAEGMRAITAKNIDVLHYSNFVPPEEYWAQAVIWLQPNQKMTMEDIHFEDIRVRSDGNDFIILDAKPMSCKYGSYENPEPGQIQNCSIRNLRVDGPQGDFNGLILITGASEDHRVTNLTLEDIYYFGKKIQKDSSNVRINEWTEGIEIK